MLVTFCPMGPFESHEEPWLPHTHTPRGWLPPAHPIFRIAPWWLVLNLRSLLLFTCGHSLWRTRSLALVASWCGVKMKLCDPSACGFFHFGHFPLSPGGKGWWANLVLQVHFFPKRFQNVCSQDDHWPAEPTLSKHKGIKINQGGLFTPQWTFSLFL